MYFRFDQSDHVLSVRMRTEQDEGDKQVCMCTFPPVRYGMYVQMFVCRSGCMYTRMHTKYMCQNVVCYVHTHNILPSDTYINACRVLGVHRRR